ncbi:hypothetical protein AB1Y20_000539 [Prymnesium parvum]|uniref:WD repeat-containing protein 19 n=1 Tax=Prymnesium parvum TaxID=97485 RepID=A0AB34K5M1_PRYPA
MRKLFTLQTQYHSSGSVIFAWHPQGSFLATCGQNRIVNIFNRQGEAHAEIPLEGTGKCLQLGWDREGELLAVLQQGSAIIKLWDANQHSESSIDTNMKDLSFIRWAVAGPQLAIGTAKGNLLIYNKRTRKKQSILGKHVKRITCGAWNSSNILALGSEDRQVTISNAEGDNLHQNTLKHEPTDLQFDSKDDTVMAVVLGGKSLLIFNVEEPERPLELVFQPRYGALVSFRWFGDKQVVLGFDSGHVVLMSTNAQEANEELFSTRLHSGRLSGLALSLTLQRAACCSGNAIKVIDFSGEEYQELTDDSMVLDSEAGTLEQIDWTTDGQILTVASDSGCVYNFLASLPVLAEASGTRYMYLTSLLELSVLDAAPDSDWRPLHIKISMEPSIIALGHDHVALGMNNHLLFHSLTLEGCPLVAEREYLGTVDCVKLNDGFVAVLCEGRVYLHALADAHETGASQVFPDKTDDRDITCLVLTKEFLIYGTQRGTITYFFLPDFVEISEYKHEAAITKLFPNELGTRVAFIDKTWKAFLYNPVNDYLIPIPSISPTTSAILWDQADWGVLVSHDSKAFNVYAYAPHSIYGPTVTPVATGIKYASGLTPIIVHNGTVTCQGSNGSITNVPLPTHEAINFVSQRGGAGPEKLKTCFQQNLSLLRLARAWDVAVLLNQRDLYLALGQATMKLLDVALAIRVYRQLADAGMVLALQKLETVEDRHLLAGHLAVIFADYSSAQEHFLQSNRPISALEMRRDLLHWEQALKLAKTLAPDQMPAISREFAQQLEFRGEYDHALSMFHKGLGEAGQREQQSRTIGFGGMSGSLNQASKNWTAQERACRFGIARMTLRLGDVSRGVQLALETGDQQCCRDCAKILEDQKQWHDAARLYEEGGQMDKAVAIYIKTKNWAAAGPLMGRITSPKLHAEFGKAKEAEGSYEEAAVAFEAASDMDSVVRLLLKHLKNPMRAFAIVRETKSSQGAMQVAEYCQNNGEIRAAIEFLVLAKKTDDAFQLAISNNLMDTFTQAGQGSFSLEENKKIAQYYETNGEFKSAGEYWFICKDYSKALRLFLQCGERAVDQAIDVVGRARSDILTHQLIDFLMGESDGVPKDPNYIFRLYMALGNYPQAAKTAIIIARQEQELGNYRVAHQILFDTHKELTSQKIRVPQELAHNLMLLHSYVLVKPLVKVNDHLAAARMLSRVARNISKFPMHVVPIITSTVIECHRAGLRGAAFEYASMLMRPEYRPEIQEAYKRKIEAIVRKPGDKSDIEEPETPSPYDPKARVPETVLECPSTRNAIPYCVASGRHITLNDLCLCPSCDFPAIYGSMAKLVESEGTCPMCSQEVALPQLKKMDEEAAKAWVMKQLQQPKSKSS